jgi:hypothetical protein
MRTYSGYWKNGKNNLPQRGRGFKMPILAIALVVLVFFGSNFFRGLGGGQDGAGAAAVRRNHANALTFYYAVLNDSPDGFILERVNIEFPAGNTVIESLEEGFRFRIFGAGDRFVQTVADGAGINKLVALNDAVQIDFNAAPIPPLYTETQAKAALNAITETLKNIYGVPAVHITVNNEEL